MDSIVIRNVRVCELCELCDPERESSSVVGYLVTIYVDSLVKISHFIQVSEEYLKNTDPFKVFNILNNFCNSSIITKIIKLGKYQYQDQIVYVEHIPKPEHIVKYGEQEYKLRLQP